MPYDIFLSLLSFGGRLLSIEYRLVGRKNDILTIVFMDPDRGFLFFGILIIQGTHLFEDLLEILAILIQRDS